MAVESAPAPPESFPGSADTSSTLTFWPDAGSTGSGCARRDIFDAGSQKLESTILSGVNSRSSKKTASRLPDAASTTQPRISTAMLYSHIVPGVVLVNTRLGELGLDVGRLHRLVLSNFRL